MKRLRHARRCARKGCGKRLRGKQKSYCTRACYRKSGALHRNMKHVLTSPYYEGQQGGGWL